MCMKKYDLNKENAYKLGKHEITVYGMKTHGLSAKENVSNVAVNKENDVYRLLRHEKTHHY